MVANQENIPQNGEQGKALQAYLDELSVEGMCS
jgi:hypothetical protein